MISVVWDQNKQLDVGSPVLLSVLHSLGTIEVICIQEKWRNVEHKKAMLLQS